MDSPSIPKLPEVPKSILQRANDRKLCFFLGSGVSTSLGCKNWNEIAHSLVEKCFELNIIDSEMKRFLCNSEDPKKVITFCKSRFYESSHETDYFNKIQDCLQPDSSRVETKNIYKVLSSLQGSVDVFYLTTNIDTIFDLYFRNQVFFKQEDFQQPPLRNRLYKIHGTIERHSSIIFTVPDYLERYSNPDFVAFLKSIFDSCAIIFLGYSLSEFEILDFLVTKIGSKKQEASREKELIHCILRSYGKDKKCHVEFDKEYFKPLGVDVVSFERGDENEEYPQLYDVVKKWVKDLTELTNVPSEDVKNMEIMVDSLE